MALTKEEQAERFLKATKAREKADSMKGGYTKEEIPTFEYLVIGQNQCKVFRMVGNTPELRSEKSDALKIERSLIVDDDGNYFTHIWSNDYEHPMRILLKKLGEYKWDKEAKGGKGDRIYKHNGCELLTRLLTNNQDNARSSGMLPSKFILINAIDRMDDWCKKNKHTKLMSWEAKEGKDGKLWPVDGIKNSFFDDIFKVKCSEVKRLYDEFDIVARRFTEKSRPSIDTNYKIYWREEKTAISNWSEKDGKDYYSFINEEDYLSDEELTYTRYDLEDVPFLSRPTPIAFTMKRLEKFIKAIDTKYGWGLWEKFVDWKAKETEEFVAKKVKTSEEGKATEAQAHESESAPEHEAHDDLPSQEEKAPPVKAPPKVVKKTTQKRTFTQAELDVFPYLDDMPEDQKALIKSINVETQEITWTKEANTGCGIEDCELAFPEEITLCPRCGTDYAEDN